MTTYRIELVRSPNITDDERQRRLNQAFDILLNFGKETADGDTLVGEPSAAIAPSPKEPGTGEIVTDE